MYSSISDETVVFATTVYIHTYIYTHPLTIAYAILYIKIRFCVCVFCICIFLCFAYICHISSDIDTSHFLWFYFAESRQFLLYARQIEIRGVDIDNPYYNYIISFTVPDIDNVTVVDYDALEHRIYWSDVRTQTIKRAFINGTGVETVVSAGEMIVWASKCILSIHWPQKVFEHIKMDSFIF